MAVLAVTVPTPLYRNGWLSSTRMGHLYLVYQLSTRLSGTREPTDPASGSGIQSVEELPVADNTDKYLHGVTPEAYNEAMSSPRVRHEMPIPTDGGNTIVAR